MKNDQDKIYNLYESLNQSAIAYDQQRGPNKDKYLPKDSKQSYRKYGIPTTSSVKVNGAPFTSNGISDEEVLVKGFGMVNRSQITFLLDGVKDDIFELLDKNLGGHVLKSKVDLYQSLIELQDQ